jgi:hypothetical protein
MQWSGVGFSMLLAALSAGCSDKEVERETGNIEDAAATTKPASAHAGGYVPTANERVPGITLTQEELDKIYQESRRSQPLDITPESHQ